ncbi:MAG: serine--tRNA ligase [Candidatus Margulisiibacteriota bacterium]
MIDPEIIRNNFLKVEKDFKNRNYPLDYLYNYRDLDLAWRKLLQEIESLRHDQKELTPKGKPDSVQLAELTKLAQTIKIKNENLQKLEIKLKDIALYLPNILLSDVPFGENAAANQEIKTWGNIKEFKATPLTHDELAEKYDFVDFNRASKISGPRLAIYKNWGAKLERALLNFMLDVHTNEHGYTEIWPPALVNAQSLTGTGQLPKFKDDLFSLSDSGFYLSPTAEVQLTNLYFNEIIPEEKLPVKLTAYTPCFRKEAGSYGKEMKGLIRQHQFDKVEIVRLEKPENSEQALEELLNHAEAILQKLELPYRVMKLCSQDIGFSAAKTYDIEVWFPSQNKYREISSCSNFLDFQARRSMLRYRNLAENKVKYLHTLNGSGLAIGRTFAAILENYQDKDGIIIPQVLKPYLGVEKIN